MINQLSTSADAMTLTALSLLFNMAAVRSKVKDKEQFEGNSTARGSILRAQFSSLPIFLAQ
jgi:hypothetical protein